MNKTPESVAQEFIGIMSAQTDLYAEILNLCHKQNDIIKNNDQAGIMEILSLKQQKIAEIENLARSSENLRVQWQAVKENANQSLRTQVEDALKKLQGTLAEIIETENKGHESLSQAKSDSGQSIAKIQKGKAMHKAYGAPKTKPQARFKDKNG